MYRTVDTTMWGDEWFQNLSSSGKFLYLYLKTNSRTEACGAYHITLRTIVFETDLTEERVRKGFEQLAAAKHVVWWEDLSYVFLPEFFSETSTGSWKYHNGAVPAAAVLPEPVREAVYERYPELRAAHPSTPPDPQGQTRKPSDTVSRLAIPSDTVSASSKPLDTVSNRSIPFDTVSPRARVTEQQQNKTEQDREERHTASRDADGAAAPRVIVDYPEPFERVYGAFPRKGKKKAALDRWKGIRPNAALIATMLAAIERLKDGRKWREGYVEYFDTWLHNQGWEDPVDDGIEHPARPNGKVVQLRPAAPVLEGFDAVYADVLFELGRWQPGEDIPHFTPEGDVAITTLGGWEVIARAGIVRANFYDAYGAAALDRRAQG